MTTQFKSFDRSRAGAFTRSRLGMRNNGGLFVGAGRVIVVSDAIRQFGNTGFAFTGPPGNYDPVGIFGEREDFDLLGVNANVIHWHVSRAGPDPTGNQHWFAAVANGDWTGRVVVHAEWRHLVDDHQWNPFWAAYAGMSIGSDLTGIGGIGAVRASFDIEPVTHRLTSGVSTMKAAFNYTNAEAPYINRPRNAVAGGVPLLSRGSQPVVSFNVPRAGQEWVLCGVAIGGSALFSGNPVLIDFVENYPFFLRLNTMP